jgi:MFS family permease
MSSAKRLMTPILLVFLGSMILANIAYNMQQPLLPLYVQHLGANVGQVGLFFTLSAIAPLLFQILGGWLSDTIGCLQAVAIGTLGGLIGYIIFPFAPSWEWLLLGMVGSAVAVSFVAPSWNAFIAEQTDPANLGKVFGISQSLYMVVGIIGPPLGGWLADRYGFQALFLVAAVLYGMATIIRLGLARHDRRERSGPVARPSLAGLKTSFRQMFSLLAAGGVVTWILISDGIGDISYQTAYQFQPLYLENQMGLTKLQIGWLASLSSVTLMLLMTAAGWLSDKKGERVGILSGFTVIVVAMTLFLFARDFAGFAVTWLLFGVGQALIGPAYNSMITKAVPPHLRGTAFGLFSTSVGLVSLPAPLIGGLLWQGVGPRATFLVPIIGHLLMLPIIWFKFRLPPEMPATPPAMTELQAVAQPASTD